MAYCKNRSYSKISQIEKDIVPAKLFSSMETSAGKMVEDIALPIFGWGRVPSGMHSSNSALDGFKIDGNLLRLATLKSGPRCLNDEMSENFADQILAHFKTWANTFSCVKIDFTYGVLYGTQKISNKKDWHILRKVKEKLSGGVMTVSPDRRWNCAFTKSGIDVSVSIRIGKDWWTHLGQHPSTYLEICIALIRSCVSLGKADPPQFGYTICDLAAIVSTDSVPAGYNVALLQEEQLPWLFFLARHFCDDLC